jgi:hypothetical protein
MILRFFSGGLRPRSENSVSSGDAVNAVLWKRGAWGAKPPEKKVYLSYLGIALRAL